MRTDPLLMNAFNNVNLAASCILTSVAYAKQLGIPESKWIYPLGGAGTQDSDDCKYSTACTTFRRRAHELFRQSGSVQTSTQVPPFHDH